MFSSVMNIGTSARQAVIPPDLQDVTDERGLVVQVAPLDVPGIVRVVLERHERQVGETAVRAQVVEEPPEP